MKPWKVASLIAAGVVVLFVMIVYYSFSVNPCTHSPSRTADNLLAPVPPKELYDGSELVVIGRITDSASKCEGSQIWTQMQVEVEDSAKNPQGIKVLTAKAYGGTIGNYGLWVEDSPIFKKGDRAFLYLYRDSPSDTVYRVNQYSGVLVLNNDLPDETISANEILRSVRLQSVTTSNTSIIDIPQGSSGKITLSLESFFGYDSPTNVTIFSFTYYNSSTSDSFSTANVTALNNFGISVEPMHTVIVPRPNGSARTEFMISAPDGAVLGRYDIEFSADMEGRYSYLTGGGAYSFVRINVTGDEGFIQQSMEEIPGVSLVIEKYGEREFYQDRKVFLPTELTVTKDDSADWDTLAWPLIGPNHVITRIDTATGDRGSGTVVFDYYESLGIDENLTGLVYDEFMRKRELSPPPATSGRYFGFEWNQTALDGTMASAGKYRVVLTMPVLIDNMNTT
ncbi:MAG: hypothetical protein ACREBU_05930, partial [Nitrososphaera sp.]